MKKYIVTICKNVTAEIEVEAWSETEAEKNAIEVVENGKVDFYDDYNELNVVGVEEI